ncbi:MAG: DUF2007 domain-containing protein [Bacteroidales bacterium]|nr:DUF2007 domain-containing protein [Bacteroidales bacterium]
MEEWIKIFSFDSQYQAEMSKDILEQCDVKSVIINAKDSLFLLGEYELYVHSSDEKKAIAVLNEFKGLTKVDSFVMRGPIERLKDELEANDITSVIKVCRNSRYVLDNYELYVANEDVQRVIPFITGEQLKGWTSVKTCTKTTQTRFRIELLNHYQIPSIVIKKRDAKFMKSEINIYVKEADAAQSIEILRDLKGWAKVHVAPSQNMAEVIEKQLGKEGVKAIIEHMPGGYFVFVEGVNCEKAKTIISQKKSWKLLETYTDSIVAQYAAGLLENSGIEVVTVYRDDIRMMVDVDLYVEEFMLDKAMEILKSISSTSDDE